MTLWMGLHLPELSLEALSGPAEKPRAVLDGHRRTARILVCDEDASAQGVRPGMSANAALALVPELVLAHRDQRQETRLLSGLADWALQFTPVVSTEEPDSLLLEVGGSLNLFGGAERMQQMVSGALQGLGHRACVACAPTPLAALWFARAGEGVLVEEASALTAKLAALPLEHLGWPAAVRRLLHELGIGTLGECMRLPRNGLARRLGPERLLDLDRAHGRCPDTRLRHEASLSFEDSLELPLETADVDILGWALDTLLQRLDDCLRRHQAGVRHIWVLFRHPGGHVTRMPIGLLETTANVSRLMELARISLGTGRLPGLVNAISLQANPREFASSPAQDLFGERPDAVSRLSLLDLLRVRLGSDAVHGIRVMAEHRPEYAWRPLQEPDRGGDALNSLTAYASRPLWMLPEPLRLRAEEGRPLFHGALTLLAGPERIETGWWDGGDIRRDYHLACNQRGIRIWIFRDLREDAWYLHGLFG